ncbi:hypothetical protein OPV22_003877 [Ensete ventricosum]|uniref:Uncharacterized protein n=1 Tax=Ensete ventricosum TaxID=4639 RepID=A0AAV8S241_ENSVE|nr:hypothetical protein OPV22_003877 [Ensete ventricosum]
MRGGRRRRGRPELGHRKKKPSRESPSSDAIVFWIILWRFGLKISNRVISRWICYTEGGRGILCCSLLERMLTWPLRKGTLSRNLIEVVPVCSTSVILKV